MKRQFLSLLVTIMAVSQVATANEICSTLQDCLKLKTEVEKKIRELQIGDSVLGDFLRDKNGKIITNVTQKQASDACERQGMRLPTAREVALEGVKIGGAALLEVSDYEAGKIPLGYAKSDFYKVTTKEEDKSTDQFYYSYEDYVRPTRDLGNHWVWSSSLHSNYSYEAFYFSGFSGDVYYSNRFNSNDGGAVRCAPRVNR